MAGLKEKTIVYVNFTPYENAGHILDFLTGKFNRVIRFTFNFHRLSPKQEPSTLTVSRDRTVLYRTRLFQTPTSPRLAFLLLPLRSLVIFAQLVFHLTRLRKRFGPYHIYFTVNAFTAFCGIILKRIGMVGQTVFWVWDYYPPVHPNALVSFMRYLYWQFDLPASLHSDRVVFLNRRLVEYRKSIGLLPAKGSYPVIPIGTRPVLKPSRRISGNNLVFFGVLKRSQGLDLVFDAAVELTAAVPGIRLSIIGSGPDEAYFRKRAQKTSLPCDFHGYVPDERRVDRLLAAASIGIAPYAYEEGNVSYFSDPSKIKRYLSLGLPVVTTDLFSFSEDIAKSGAGVVIRYRRQDLVDAVVRIRSGYRKYSDNALRLSKVYEYRKLYDTFFR